MVKAWYDESIEKIRFTADPGGEALTVEEARERIAELETAVAKADSS